MWNGIAQRLSAWRTPQARQARRARRRRAWNDALAEKEARDRSYGPSPTSVEQRGLRERSPRRP